MYGCLTICILENLRLKDLPCATDFTQGWLDMFIFSNGVDVKYIYSNTETHTRLVVEDDANIHLVDAESRDVSGLGLVVFDSRLWIFNDKVV